MIFIICIVIGILGIMITLWIAQKPESIAFPEKKAWVTIHPEVWESHISSYLIDSFREILKEILISLLHFYRTLSKKITVKKVVKQHIRKFLTEPRPETPAKTSPFWEQVRDGEKKIEDR